MQWWLIPILLAVNYIPYKALFRLFFPTREDFQESVHYSWMPDIVSLFKGEYMRDRAAELRLGAFLFVCLAMLGAEYFLIIKVLHALGTGV